MNFNTKSIISYCFLLLYLLMGLFGSGCASICLGSEHSRHIGINILGYEPCCHSDCEVAKISDKLSDSQDNLIVHQKCDCNDTSVYVDNMPQNIHSTDYVSSFFESIKIINNKVAFYITSNINEFSCKLLSGINIYQNRHKITCINNLDTIILQI